MSKHILWIFQNNNAHRAFKTKLYLKEFGRMKVKASINPFFYTSKYQTIKDARRNNKGIIKKLLTYED